MSRESCVSSILVRLLVLRLVLTPSFHYIYCCCLNIQNRLKIVPRAFWAILGVNAWSAKLPRICFHCRCFIPLSLDTKKNVFTETQFVFFLLLLIYNIRITIRLMLILHQTILLILQMQLMLILHVWFQELENIIIFLSFHLLFSLGAVILQPYLFEVVRHDSLKFKLNVEV